MGISTPVSCPVLEIPASLTDPCVLCTSCAELSDVFSNKPETLQDPKLSREKNKSCFNRIVFVPQMSRIPIAQNTSSWVKSSDAFMVRIQHCPAFVLPITSSAGCPEGVLWLLVPGSRACAVLAGQPLGGAPVSLRAFPAPPQGRGLQVHRVRDEEVSEWHVL